MKKVLTFALVFTLTITLGYGFALAGNDLSGPHWGFNIIGHPKNVDVLKNDNSNGRAIMVPLKNANGPGLESIVCEDDEYVITPDDAPTFRDQEPTGAKIYFTPGDDFEIIDRDATDNDGAEIMVPTTTSNGDTVLTVDIYVRVLGKPTTCMDIDGYAFDGNYWFWSGSVDLNRKHGKASWVDVRELFDVWYCQVSAGACVAGTEEEISVFNNVFQNYFWNILNDGTRLVQVRLYPKS